MPKPCPSRVLEEICTSAQGSGGPKGKCMQQSIVIFVKIKWSNEGGPRTRKSTSRFSRHISPGSPRFRFLDESGPSARRFLVNDATTAVSCDGFCTDWVVSTMFQVTRSCIALRLCEPISAISNAMRPAGPGVPLGAQRVATTVTVCASRMSFETMTLACLSLLGPAA